MIGARLVSIFIVFKVVNSLAIASLERKLYTIFTFRIELKIINRVLVDFYKT
jgi:hypothetical protein